MEERQAHVVEIKAPVGDVWAEITKLRQIQKPMVGTILDTDFKPGSRMIYRSEDGKRVFIIGEVREFEPPRRFVHTFRFTNCSESPTLVEWDLEEKERDHPRHRDPFEVRRPDEDRRFRPHQLGGHPEKTSKR